MKDLLLESSQVGKLYHFTSLPLSMSIVNDDMLYAGYQHSSKFMSVSFTRNKNFVSTDSPRSSLGGNDIGFVVDGNKLSTKYKMSPIADRMDFGDESEEVVIGKVLERDQGIKNFSKYILGVVFSPKLLSKIEKNQPFSKKITDKDYEYLIAKNLGDDFNESDPISKIKKIESWFEDKGIRRIK